MRAALHAHILLWMKLREKPPKYKPLDSIERSVKGTEQRQRKLDEKTPALLHQQEDNIYHTAFVNRVSTEMARPNLGENGTLGGFDVEKLRIVGLARCLQTKLCLHACTTGYCLKNRSTCHCLSFAKNARSRERSEERGQHLSKTDINRGQNAGRTQNLPKITNAVSLPSKVVSSSLGPSSLALRYERAL